LWGVTLPGEAKREAPAQGRVEIWRGGGRFSLNCARPFRLSVSEYLTMSPVPDPAHQTGRAVFLHPAFGQGFLCFRPRQVIGGASQTVQAQLLLQILVAEALLARIVQLMLLA
jgi:hypothetical protein